MFIKNIILVLFSLFSISYAFGRKSKNSMPSITNGEEALLEEVPFFASIFNGALSSPYPFCGASIIKPNIILTAAHCLLNDSISYMIRYGTVEFNNPKYEDIKIIKKFSHPQFDRESKMRNDIAIGVLEKPVREDNNVKCAKLETGPVKIGSQVKVFGFGLTEKGQLAKTLQKTILKVYAVTNTNEIMAKKNNTGSCFGDSGGPLTSLNRKLIAVLGWREAEGPEGKKYCVVGGENYFTQISSYMNFIKDTVKL